MIGMIAVLLTVIIGHIAIFILVPYLMKDPKDNNEENRR
jgi:hypothetical protein